MSVQFGRWNFEGQPAREDYLERVRSMLAPYGPDSNESYTQGGVTIVYRAFHTTKESRRESQPHISRSGAVITWDGRLDNRAELIRELHSPLRFGATDVDIIATAYDNWGTNCFGKLIGDWALSIWNPTDRSLILAKDPVGPRHLYYSFDEKQVTWSSILEPLCAEQTFALCEEYVAGWLFTFPAAHLTPYIGIHSVPPSSCVLLEAGHRTVRQFWDFDPQKRIRYRTDSEYEEHFRTIFGTAVQRRLRSDAPVLAELSGGRDSSSIVCVADTTISLGKADAPRLDTISWYDDSEPSWNDRPYFTIVEQKRGRIGWQVNVTAQEGKKLEPCQFHADGLLQIPNDRGISSQIGMCVTSQGHRVLLSGFAGDEIMGGVPIATPELQDLLASAQFRVLARQLRAWALEKRRPWLQLLVDAVRGFLPPRLVGVPKHLRPAPWLQPSFVKRHWAALTGFPSRVRLFGPPSSFQDNLSTLNGLRRQLACKTLAVRPPYEKRYPFLDRTLLEFMFAIPPEQSVRPTQRRSLMRRALVGIVPDDILNRKSKALVARAPLLGISADWVKLTEMTQQMLSSSLGIVDSHNFLAALEKARRGEELSPRRLTRTMYFEAWLRKALSSGTVSLDGVAARVGHARFD